MFCAKHLLLVLTALYPFPFSLHPPHAEAQLNGGGCEETLPLA